MPRNALGRGLGALIREPEPTNQAPDPAIDNQAHLLRPQAEPPLHQRARPSLTARRKSISISSSLARTNRAHDSARKLWTNWHVPFRQAELFNPSWFGRSGTAFN